MLRVLISSLFRDCFKTTTGKYMSTTNTTCWLNQNHSTHRIDLIRRNHTCANNDNWLDFKILTNDNPKLLDQLTFENTNIELDDVELSFSGEKVIFNLTWLRDSCHCSQCTHQHSRQRLFTVKDFRRSMFAIDEIKISPKPPQNGNLQHAPESEQSNSGYLNIRWTDSHESVYSIDWLRYVARLYSESQIRIGSRDSILFSYPKDDYYNSASTNNCAPDYWNVAKLNSNLEPLDYSDLIDGFKFNDEPTFINANRIKEMSPIRFNALKSLTNQLVTYGLAKIWNVPLDKDQVLKVARSLAYERPTGYGTVFNVVVEPSEQINLAYSSLEFDLHSDLTYRETSPGTQLLHCIRNSSQGGLSYFSDAFYASEVLRKTSPILFSVLTQFPITFAVRDPYRDVKFRKQKPVISLDDQGNLSDIYYSPFTLPPIGFRYDVKLFYLAIDRFTQILQSKENKLISKMNSGDLFIFHNRRVLHGRSSYDATTSSRFLQGCYMDWDEIKCLSEKLNSHI